MTAQIANKKGTVKSIQPAHWVHVGQLASIGQRFPIIQLRNKATIGIAGGNGNFLESGERASKFDTSGPKVFRSDFGAIFRHRAMEKQSERECAFPTEIQSSKLPEFLSTASKATVETGNSVVILAIADLGSATGATESQPNHEGCPYAPHGSTVVLLAINSSAIKYHYLFDV
jgi:hypothetical protein